MALAAHLVPCIAPPRMGSDNFVNDQSATADHRRGFHAGLSGAEKSSMAVDDQRGGAIFGNSER